MSSLGIHIQQEFDENHSTPRSSDRVQKTTKRKRYERHWLCKLRTLPDSLYREVVRRFAYGETAKAMAKLILEHKDRGGCQTLSFNTLRQYLQVLRKKVLQTDSENPKSRTAKIHNMAKDIQKEEIRQANVVAIRSAVDAVKSGTPISSTVQDPAIRQVAEIETELKRIIATLSSREAIAYSYAVNELRILPALELEERLGVPLDSLTRMVESMRRCAVALLECERTELNMRVGTAKMRMKGTQYSPLIKGTTDPLVRFCSRCTRKLAQSR